MKARLTDQQKRHRAAARDYGTMAATYMRGAVATATRQSLPHLTDAEASTMAEEFEALAVEAAVRAFGYAGLGLVRAEGGR